MTTISAASRRDLLAGSFAALLAFATLSGRGFASPLRAGEDVASRWLSRASGTGAAPRFFHALSRGLAMIPGRAPAVAIAERGLYAVAARPAQAADLRAFERESIDQDSASVVRSKFIGIMLDPWTMQPIDTYTNEFTGSRMPVENRLIEETMLVTPQGVRVRGGSDAASPFRTRSLSEAVFGDETIITGFDTSLAAADARPSVTSLSYRAMRESASASVDFQTAALFPAEEWPWLGFPAAMKVQLMVNGTGRSVGNPAALDPALRARSDARADFLSFAD